jgi:nitrogen regulatory protein PII
MQDYGGLEMVDCSETKHKALITIIDSDHKDNLEDIFIKYNMPINLLMYGQGSAKSVIYDILGYGGSKKIISISILARPMLDFIMNQLYKKLHLNKPGTGIAFTVSLSTATSMLLSVSKMANENFKKGCEDMTEIVSGTAKEPYHLIITIVNAGYFEKVMEAAKSAGATGGTLVHARGLGSKEATKYLRITVHPEKDVVLILTPQEKKVKIMQSIAHEAGLNTPAMGTSFSIPVNSIMGFDTIFENEQEL